MKCRLAVPEDLPEIQAMYREIIREMEAQGISIWDDSYPCTFFEEDVRARRLYLLEENREIVAACALCASNGGETAVGWTDCRAGALYLDRLGVRARDWQPDACGGGRGGKGAGSGLPAAVCGGL